MKQWSDLKYLHFYEIRYRFSHNIVRIIKDNKKDILLIYI